ncbi:MAG: phosphatase PAP2 family protein [Candidatus Limivivens sp.]|nr:phosphatase PAP2 family protein [Candidatus Limivivens sp.]
MNFLYFLEGIRNPVLDAFFQLCTYLGQDIPIVLILCILFWCVNKRLAYQIGLSFFGSGLLLQNLKITFRVDRPWILDPDFKPVASAVPAATGYSFPSGHTQSAAALFSTLALYVKKRGLKVLFVFCFLLVGFSRMYLGVHTPKDVCTAIFLAVAMSVFVNLLMNHLSDSKRLNGLLALILAACSAATILYARILLHRQVIEEIYALDCCKAAGAGLGFALGWYLERCHIRFSVEGSLSFQIKKAVCGLTATLLLKLLFKAVLGETIPGEILQNALLVLWILAGYPLFIKFFRHS